MTTPKEYRDRKRAEDPQWAHNQYVKRRAHYDSLSPEDQAKHKEDQKRWHQHTVEKHPLLMKTASRKFQVNNKDVILAKCYAGRYAPLKDKCEECGGTKGLSRHHDDYTKPLEVRTLCRKCHGVWHRQFEPKGKPQDVIDYFKNRHCDSCSKTWPTCGSYHISYKGKSCSRWEQGQQQSKDGVNKE